jgi:hypothetical protein
MQPADPSLTRRRLELGRLELYRLGHSRLNLGRLDHSRLELGRLEELQNTHPLKDNTNCQGPPTKAMGPRQL